MIHQLFDRDFILEQLRQVRQSHFRVPRHARALVLVTIVGLAPSAGAQSPAAVRIVTLTNEMNAVRPLACEVNGARSDSFYKKALVGAINELRSAVRARIDEIQNNREMTEDEKQLIIQQKYGATLRMIENAVPAAIANDETRAVATVCSFGTAMAAPRVQRPLDALPPNNERLKLSRAMIDFGDKEVNGDVGEDSFLISNDLANTSFQIKTRGPENASTHRSSEDFKPELKGQDSEPCGEVLQPRDHCRVYLKFAPTTAGSKKSTVFVEYREVKADGSTDETKTTYTVKVELTGSGHVNDIVTLTSNGPESHHPAFRSVMGFDISAASSSSTQQKYFVEFDLNVPIGYSSTVCVPNNEETGSLHSRASSGCQVGKHAEARIDPLNHRLWAFFNPRVTSVPQSATPLSTLNVQGFSDFIGNSAKKTDIVQGLDVQGGFEWLLLKPRSGLPFWAPYKNMRARVGIAWVIGGGFTTPFSAISANPTVFVLPPASNPPLTSDPRVRFSNTIDPTTGKTVPIPSNFADIAFVNKDRSRFFRKYYTGVRLKSYHFTDRARGLCDPGYDRPCEALHDTFPGIIDLTVGQDEQVTGGLLSGWVFRVDAIYPLPIVPGAHIFASVLSGLQKNKVSDPLILTPDPTIPVTDPKVFVVPVGQPNRDIYRIGLGIDLLQVLKKSAGKKNQQQAPTDASIADPKDKGATPPATSSTPAPAQP
jgi:hypothetical protein